MAFIVDDRVRETSTAPGTGPFTTNGAVQGAQSFASVLTVNGDTTWYFATNGTAWETGLLTRTSATVYARTTIYSSSNADAVVNFSTGTVDVACDLPASKAFALAFLGYTTNLLSAGPNGSANPTLQVDGTTASAITGLKISGLAAASAGVQLSAISSGADAYLALAAKGAGVLYLQNGVGGLVVVTGALTIGGLVDASGSAAGQIKFPGTQNPSTDVNTLDDYKEGTWTPVFTFATPGDLSVTYSVQSGSYIKIGKLVTVTFNILLSAFTHTTASGDLIFTGLPFTCQNTANDRWRGTLQFQGITKAGYTNFTIGPLANTTTMILVASGSAVAIATVTAANMPTGGNVVLQGSVTYMATA